MAKIHLQLCGKTRVDNICDLQLEVVTRLFSLVRVNIAESQRHFTLIKCYYLNYIPGVQFFNNFNIDATRV